MEFVEDNIAFDVGWAKVRSISELTGVYYAATSFSFLWFTFCVEHCK